MSSSHHHIPWRVYATHAIFQTDVAHIWPLVADFQGLARLLPEFIASGSTEGEGVGMVRHLKLTDGKTLSETLIGLHPETYRLSYAMRDPAPFPWRNYFSAIQLQSLGANETHFSYTGYYHCEDEANDGLRRVLRASYHALFGAVGRSLNIPVAIQE